MDGVDILLELKTGVSKPNYDYGVGVIEKSMRRGIRIGKCEDIREELNELISELGKHIKDRYGIKNAASPKQVADYIVSLDDDVAYYIATKKHGYENKDGAIGTGQEVLEELSNMGYEFAELVLKYRKLSSMLSMIKQVYSKVELDGCIHPTVSLGITNRVNYAGPALMNIHKQLLWNIIEPYDNTKVLYTVDIKNQEPSIMADVLKCDKIRDLLKSKLGLYEALFNDIFKIKTRCTVFVASKGANQTKRVITLDELSKTSLPKEIYADIQPEIKELYIEDGRIGHVKPCAVMTVVGELPDMPDYVDIILTDGRLVNGRVKWGSVSNEDIREKRYFSVDGYVDTYEVKCTEDQRKEIKTCWNAMTYGASKKSIVSRCSHIDGELVFKYFEGIKEFSDYVAKSKELIRKQVNEVYTLFGTAVSIQDAKLQGRAKGLRCAMNRPIQGTGTDILMFLIERFGSEVKKRNLDQDMWIYYSRHDELVVEVSKELINKHGKNGVSSILHDILEHKIDESEPFKMTIAEVEKNAIDVKSIME